jgi:hypothetical protein
MRAVHALSGSHGALPVSHSEAHKPTPRRAPVSFSLDDDEEDAAGDEETGSGSSSAAALTPPQMLSPRTPPPPPAEAGTAGATAGGASGSLGSTAPVLALRPIVRVEPPSETLARSAPAAPSALADRRPPSSATSHGHALLARYAYVRDIGTGAFGQVRIHLHM